MAISIACSNCDKTLKVPDEMAGKKIRCPACKAVVAVPAADEEEVDVEEDVPPPKKKSTGAIKKEAPPPLRKRRDEEEDEVDRDEEEEDDRPRRRKRRRADDDDDDDDDDFDVRRRPRKPHRAGTVLTLGILSIFSAFCCPLVAWIMGGIALNMANADLSLMKSRKMDREGEGNTNAGKICAIVGIILGTINAIAGVILKVTGVT